MTFPNRLLPLLLAVAGCSIAASPNDLAPKSDAECAASGQKACGYKCVGLDDPATGCGAPGCAPCAPLGPHMVPACAIAMASSLCGYVCQSGWDDCNGDVALDGCETPLDTDSNCGRCGRSCGSASCSAGACGAEWLGTWREPRGIVSRGDVVYWVESGGNGDVYRWDPAYADGTFAWWNAENIATDLDAASTNAVFRLATYRDGALFASGATAAGDLSIFSVDPAAAATGAAGTLVYSMPDSTSVSMRGLAVVPRGVFFTTDADAYVHYVVTPTTDGRIATGSSVPLRGLTAYLDLVYFGYWDTISYVDPANTSSGEQALLWSLRSWPSRTAMFPDPRGAYFFWANEFDGSVERLAGQVIHSVDTPGEVNEVEMDVAADDWGVVWCSNAGYVRAWRFADGAVFDLPAGGGIPRGVALTPSHIYWTEAGSTAAPDPGILRIPK